MEKHLITLMIATPLIGALVQMLSRNFFRWLALGASVISSLAGFILIGWMKPHAAGTQAAEFLPWVGSYAISYHVAADGLNILVILLVSIVFPILILSEWDRKKGGRGLLGLFLVLQTALLGIICAQDLFLIFFFWALASLPFYFLISLWGEGEKESAGFRYLISAAIGNALFFAALVFIYYAVEPHTFLIQELMGGRVSGELSFGGRTLSISRLTFFVLGISFLFRIPIWPFHGWFSFLIRQAPTSVLVAFCGVFVPVSLYLFGRLAYSLFPEEILRYADVLIALGSINIVFGSLTAVAQRDLRMLYGSTTIVHVGLLILGVGSLETTGFVGAVYQQLVSGLGLSGFGMFVGLFVSRMGETEFLNESRKPVFGGVAFRAPVLSLATAVMVVSLLGFPGMGGFVGQALIVIGGYSVHPSIVFVIAIGLILLTYGLFLAYRSVFLGGAKGIEGFEDLTIREKSFLVPIVTCILWLGVFPKPLLDLVKPSVLELLTGLR